MNRCRVLTITLVLGTLQSSVAAGEPAKNYGFQVPEGFEVSLYADDSLATDIHSLTIDSHGRVVVASKGYIKILHDTKGVGKADKATLFADFPKSGAHGMYFDGNDLICNGDQGVRRLYDTKGVGRCDKVSAPWFPTKNDGEHSANGIVPGPDGWYYLITGNDAGITGDLVNSPRSPIKQPNSGVVLRFSPDGQKREIFAHGFRNPYDLAFNQFGQLFTVDADGERVYHMPYYAPTRLFDITQGMHHGWITSGWMRSWSRPPIWPDNVERMVEIGRGSPTGLIVYRHRAFPEKYRGGVFSLCWTFGRLYFMPLNRSGSSYESKMEVFMRTTGDVGFAPTDMAVGPDGDLFIAIGGRGTRGSVFRVHYKGAAPEPLGKDDPLKAVLAADEPLASWSRARWVPKAEKLGKEAFRAAVLNDKLPLLERIRAVEVLTELFGGVAKDLAWNICLFGKHDPELVARVIWSLSRGQDDSLDARQILVSQTRAVDPRIARAAWEAIESLPSALDSPELTPHWNSALVSADRRVRRAAVRVAMGKGRDCFTKFRAENRFPREELTALWVDGPPTEEKEAYLKKCAVIFTSNANADVRLEAVRLMQIALGDLDSADGSDRKFAGYASDKAFVGYVARRIQIDASGKPHAPLLDQRFRQKLSSELTKGFPPRPDFHFPPQQSVDLELARLLAMLEADVPGLPDRLTNRFTKESTVEQDIHYLLCVARLPGKRSADATRKTASALNGIHIKLARRGEVPSDFTPTILEALLERLVLLDPALPAALVADPTFGIPGHSLFANKLPEDAEQAAARKLLAALGKLDADQARTAWSPDFVRLIASLPDEESLPVLRAHSAEPSVADSIALLLAQKRRPEDRGRWLDALVSTQPAVVSAAAEALLSLKDGPTKVQPLDSGKVVRSLRRLETQKADVKIQQTLVALLEKWNGKLLAPTATKETPAGLWLAWFTKTHPKEAVSLPGLASADFATWKKRLDKIAWDDGDVRRGEVVFQRKNCYRCHGESRRLGPDLTGAAQRFSRDDLFVAIFDPSKDIAPAFKPISVATRSGKVHNGMIIYESQQLVLLQTGPDTTVRIPGEDVESIQPSNVSFMPAGLLDDLTDSDLRDLYAYLKTLKKK